MASIRNAQGVPKAWINRRLGGDQIDYADETPMVRKLFTGARQERSDPAHGPGLRPGARRPAAAGGEDGVALRRPKTVMPAKAGIQ